MTRVKCACEAWSKRKWSWSLLLWFDREMFIYLFIVEFSQVYI